MKNDEKCDEKRNNLSFWVELRCFSSKGFYLRTVVFGSSRWSIFSQFLRGYNLTPPLLFARLREWWSHLTCFQVVTILPVSVARNTVILPVPTSYSHLICSNVIQSSSYLFKRIHLYLCPGDAVILPVSTCYSQLTYPNVIQPSYLFKRDTVICSQVIAHNAVTPRGTIISLV